MLLASSGRSQRRCSVPCNAQDRPHDKPAGPDASSVCKTPALALECKSSSQTREGDKSQALSGEENSLAKGMALTGGSLSGLIHNERQKLLCSVSGNALIRKDTGPQCAQQLEAKTWKQPTCPVIDGEEVRHTWCNMCV